MSNRETFYYKEVLKKERLNSEFGNLENALWKTFSDRGLLGIISGGAVAASTSAATITVEPFVATDKNGGRMELTAETVFDFSTDFSGAPTIPSAGNFRWVTAVLRYAKLGSSPVTDGDGATVYTVETEGFSSTGDVTVDVGAANFGKIRFVKGTESGSSTTANRPGVSDPDVILCDLLLDDTGKVHLAPNGGISFARTPRPALQEALTLSNFDWDVTKYVLLNGWRLFDDGLAIRMYAHRDQDGDPSLAFTINAWWDGVNKVWTADVAANKATLVEVTTSGLLINTQNRGAFSWTDHRHATDGWDGRMTFLANIANGDVSVDGGGRITGTGGQTAYAAYGGPSDPTVTSMRAGFTWAQRMAAVPSSVTLAAGLAVDANIVGGSAGAAFNDVGGELIFTVNTLGQHVYCARVLTAVP